MKKKNIIFAVKRTNLPKDYFMRLSATPFLFLACAISLLTSAFSSCSSDNEFKEGTVKNDVVLESNLNFEDFKAISKKTSQKISSTRSVDGLLSEEQAQELLLPLLEDGKSIRRTVLSSIAKDSPEYKEYSEMTDQDLILLSVIASVNSVPVSTRALGDLTGSQVINCITSALGIPSGISGLRLSGLMTARTGLQVLRTVATRYALGYVALAFAVYQFGDCINDIAHVL